MDTLKEGTNEMVTYTN